MTNQLSANESCPDAINHYRMDIGWIHMLGVRPAWRKKGLGLALLHHSFGEILPAWDEDHRSRCGCIQRAAGATWLYQKAGDAGQSANSSRLRRNSVRGKRRANDDGRRRGRSSGFRF